MGRRSRSRSRERGGYSKRRHRSSSPSSSDSEEGHRRRRRRRRDSHGDDNGGDSHTRRHRSSVPYVIPETAPRMRVPANLPVEVTSFIDLFSLFVSRGGPTLEEEVKYRERGNPYFAFLSAPWNDPMNVYYRWRLHALLQEGARQFMRWSTEPYQLEQGAEAVVWIPPPIIQNGTEHLSTLSDIVTRDPQGVDLEQCIAEHRKPAALWLSRLVTNDETFFVALRGSDATRWSKMLDYESAWSSSSPPLREAEGTNIEHAMEHLESFKSKVLAPEYIAERMCFAIEHRDSGVHCISFLMDEITLHVVRLVGLCETSRWIPSSDGATETSSSLLTVAKSLIALYSLMFILHDICKNAHATPLSEAEIIRAVDVEEEEAAKQAASAAATKDKKASSSTVLPIDAFLQQAAAGTSAKGNVGVTSASRARGVLIRGIEWCLPSIIEGLVRATVACAGMDGAGQSKGVGVSIQAPQTDGVLSDYDPQPTVNLALRLPTLFAPTNTSTSSSSSSATAGGAAPPPLLGDHQVASKKLGGEICVLSLQLLSWVRSLIIEWGDGAIIGTRCWLKLQETYSFLVCQPIEDVSS